jgi:pimeloyl-ACP methyl ester carboxylesterase
MGGRVVVRLAAECGAALRAVIGLEGSDHPSPWYDDSWLDRPEFLRGDFCAALVSGLVAPQSPDECRWETLWHYYQSGPEVFKGDMHFYRTDSEYRGEAAASGGCPVYLMTGEYDYSCTPELTRASAARIPGAEAIIMEGLGHFPMSENPQRFRQYLLPVLERIAARG